MQAKLAGNLPVQRETTKSRWKKGSYSTHRNELCKAVQSCFSVLARPHYAIEQNAVGVPPCLSLSFCLPASLDGLSHSGALIQCQDNVPIVAIMPHAKRQFGQCLGHKLQHFGYQHLVTLHLAKQP